VIAGHTDAVERAIVLAKQNGAKLAQMLPVSVPSHCELMKPAALALQKMLADTPFRSPEIPVINNVDALCYDSVAHIREGLVRQLYSPVQWVKTIQACHQRGVVRFFECGPGKVLTGLGKRIMPDAEWMPATDRVRLLERG
jgi:[acyl-carrier-protein] S-malonyltransferase